MVRVYFIVAAILFIAACRPETSVHHEVDKQASVTQIAFLADVHLHDFYAAGERVADDDLPLDPLSQEPLLMRSMQAQLNSTRLFNENYFVFRAALDDIAKRGIKLVALPGDFSDDGQPSNVIALNAILDEYSQHFGMRFFSITGNHDPTRPFTRAGGKRDFLNKHGQEVSVYSPDHDACKTNSAWQCNDALREWGYAGIVDALSAHGFFGHDQDLYFETPFGSKDFSKRGWQWCDDNQDCVFMPDASYLSEPVDGVWLLAIDANVYIPKGSYANKQFNGSGNAGYNALIEYKPKLMAWIADVVKRAEKQGKRLVAFSHFPMTDFYDHTQPELASLFGETGMQLKRMPTAETTRALAETGLKLHMAGHMHIYDVGNAASDSLVNIQVPSLAAYQPGYSIVRLLPDHEAEIETIILSDVPDFDRLFPIYEQEWAYRESKGLPNWDKRILAAHDYLDFTDGHLKEVVVQRYLGREWPESLASSIKQSSVNELVGSAGCAVGPELKALGAEWLNEPALLMAFDFYRLRGAGQFADLDGRRGFYRALATEVGAGRCASDGEGAALVRQFFVLLADTASDEDVTSLRISL